MYQKPMCFMLNRSTMETILEVVERFGVMRRDLHYIFID